VWDASMGSVHLMPDIESLVRTARLYTHRTDSPTMYVRTQTRLGCAFGANDPIVIYACVSKSCRKIMVFHS
jgi:hypothetical protein